METRTRRLALLCSWALAALVAPPAAFGAGAPLETGGFESYTLGSLVPVYPDEQPHFGQQGWVGVGVGPDQVRRTTNVENAVVQSDVVKTGSMALQVDRADGIDNRWAVIFGTSPNPETLAVTLPENQPMSLPSQRFVLIDWDMRIADAGGDGMATLGPFFGVEAWDASTSSIGLLGSLGVDASTGQVVYQSQSTGYVTNTGQAVDFDTWHHFALLLDFSVDTYTMFLDGAPIVPTGSVAAPQTFVDNGPLVNLNQFTDADVAALSIFDNPESNAVTGTAYFDNFRVLDGVPGDFDFDGDVDGADLATWRGAMGSTADGDADGDGDTDGDDFLIWQQNLGVDLTPSVPVSLPVPEPASWALLAVASLVGRLRRRA